MGFTLTGWQSSDFASPTELNLRVQEVEDALNGISDGSNQLSSPEIADFTNATHDHSNAANGGQIGASGINSGGATAGQTLQANGSGGASFANAITTFIGLSDTPSNFTNRKWNMARVNQGETALVFVQPGICQVQRTTTQSISNNTTTAVQFTGTDVLDPLAMHNPASNPERIQIPEQGFYLVSASVEWAVAGANGSARLEIWHRDTSAGATYRMKVRGGAVSTTGTNVIGISGMVFIDDITDWIEIRVWQNSGGPVNIQPTSSPDFYSIRAEVALLWAHSGFGT